MNYTIHNSLRLMTIVGGISFCSAAWLQAKTLTFQQARDGDTRMAIDGTSNVRDWDAVSGKIEGKVEIANNGFWSDSGMIPGNLPIDENSATEAIVRIEASSLVSDSRRLTRNLHDYLAADEYPYIEFELNSLELINDDDNDIDPNTEMDLFTTVATGLLTVSGDTREVSLPVHWSRQDNQLILEGTTKLKMSDFGIDPPTMFLGTLRTVDEFDVEFKWVLEPKA